MVYKDAFIGAVENVTISTKWTIMLFVGFNIIEKHLIRSFTAVQNYKENAVSYTNYLISPSIRWTILSLCCIPIMGFATIFHLRSRS